MPAETDEMRARAREIWEKYYPATVNIPAMIDDIAALGTAVHAAGHAEGRAEVERLREGRDLMGNLWANAKDEIAELRGEVERLREALRGMISLLDSVDPGMRDQEPPPPELERARAALAASPEPQSDGGRPLPFERDELGRMVREAWVRWAQTQPNPKASWLVPYDELEEADREADRQIGEAISRWTLIGVAAADCAQDKDAT